MDVTLMEGIGVVIGAILFTIWNMWFTTQRAKRTEQNVSQHIEKRVIEAKQETKTEVKRDTEDFFERYAKQDIEAQKKRNEELEETLDHYMDKMDKLTERTAQLEKDNIELKYQADLERANAEKRKIGYEQQMEAQKAEYTAQNAKITEQLNLVMAENKDVVTERDYAVKEMKRLNDELSTTKQRVYDLELTVVKLESREQTLMLVLEKFQVVKIETVHAETPSPDAPPAPPTDEAA